MTYVSIGNPTRAREYAEHSMARCERTGDRRLLAHVLDTRARIALAEADTDGALALASQSIEVAQEQNNHRAQVDALFTRGRAYVAAGDADAALAAYSEAADAARAAGTPAQLREVLGEWAGELARAGKHAEAYQLTREALAARS